MREPTEAPEERAAGQNPDAWAAGHLALPLRAAGDRPTVHRGRLTDDPEMLELVLAGLLNLP